MRRLSCRPQAYAFCSGQRERREANSPTEIGVRNAMSALKGMVQPARHSTDAGRADLHSLNELHCSEDAVVAHQAYYPVNMQGRMHSHARAQLICATTSPVDVVAGEWRWTLHPGHAAWLPGGLGHSVSGRGASVFRSLYIRPDLAKSLGGEACVLRLSPLLRELLLRLINIYDDDGDRAIYPHLTALALHEIARAEPRPQISPPCFRRPRTDV